MTDEQKQKRRDYQRECYKKYYAAKKLNNKIINDSDNENNKIIDDSEKIIDDSDNDNKIIDDSDKIIDGNGNNKIRILMMVIMILIFITSQ